LASPENLNFEFAKIIANNYTVEEQPMWDASSEELSQEENNYVYKDGDVLDILTIAYIPNVGRFDIVIVREDTDGGINGTF
jgi:hypothetical protein|tara:strand:- start:225 stop:467 length:243 start_codon:yes stop_codon:yes gene_type:complete